jgi:hypothetical protein
MYCKNEDRCRDYCNLFPTTRHNDSPTRIRIMNLEPHHPKFHERLLLFICGQDLLSERYIEYILIRAIGLQVFIWTLHLAQMKHGLSTIATFHCGWLLLSCLVITNNAAPHTIETSRFYYCMAKQSNTPKVCISFYWAKWCIFTTVSIAAVNNRL